mmetsp:Transcript_28482/g.60610  ORF Transcript_28482/g.60610 Transcript_28482/m.60610 type:complete len:218 (+) Transcript_28482:346-999(+)
MTEKNEKGKTEKDGRGRRRWPGKEGSVKTRNESKGRRQNGKSGSKKSAMRPARGRRKSATRVNGNPRRPSKRKSYAEIVRRQKNQNAELVPIGSVQSVRPESATKNCGVLLTGTGWTGRTRRDNVIVSEDARRTKLEPGQTVSAETAKTMRSGSNESRKIGTGLPERNSSAWKLRPACDLGGQQQAETLTRREKDGSVTWTEQEKVWTRSEARWLTA